MPRKPRVPRPKPPAPRSHKAKYRPARKPGDEVNWTWIKPHVIARGNGYVLAILEPGDSPTEALSNLGEAVPMWDVRAPARTTAQSYLIRMCMRTARYTGVATAVTWLYYAIPCPVVDAGEVGPGLARILPIAPRHRPPKLIGDGKRIDFTLPTSLIKSREPAPPPLEPDEPALVPTRSRFIVTPRPAPPAPIESTPTKPKRNGASWRAVESEIRRISEAEPDDAD